MSHPCDTVLVPSEVRTKSDYSIAQAYVYVNAARDYEKLKSGNNVDQSLGIVYKVFELDLANSSSAQEFQERVRERLTTMKFSMTAEAAESHYRRGIEPFQATAWLECQKARAAADGKANSSQLIAYVGETTKESAAIHFDYRPGVGVDDHVIHLSADGCLVDGQSVIQKDLGGPEDTIWKLTKIPGVSQALVIAKVGGSTAALKVDFGHIANQGGMLGDTITIARRAGASHLDPYPWTPPEVQVTAFSAPLRWIAAGKEYMHVTVTKFSVLFEITELSQFYQYGSPGFDGFVLRGFDRQITAASLTQNAPLQFKLSHDQDEVRIDIRGLAPSGTSFTLNLEFA